MSLGRYLEDLFFVNSFALDDPARSKNERLNNQYKLDEDTFFSYLYKERKLGNSVFDKLLFPQKSPILICGYPGMGKTTLVCYAIHKLKSKIDNLFLVKIDFKNECRLDDKDSDFLEKHDDFIRKIATHHININHGNIYRFVCAYVKEFYDYHKKVRYTIDLRLYVNFELIRKLDDLYSDDYSWSDKSDIYTWLLAKEDDQTIKDVCYSIFDSMTIQCIFNCISIFDNKYIVLFYDNIDSVELEVNRNTLIKHVRELANQLVAFCNVVITMRKKTLFCVNNSDHGTFYWEPSLLLDYSDLIDDNMFRQEQDKFEQQHKRRPNAFDKYIIKQELIHNNASLFIEQLYKKRSEYFQEKYLFSYPNDLAINNQYNLLCNSIFSNPRIANELFFLSNFDRRYSTKYIERFFRFLVELIKIDLASLKEQYSDFNLIIETLFYLWINSPDENSSHHISTQDINFNQICFIKKSFKDVSNVLSCNLGLLVLNLLINLLQRDSSLNNSTAFFDHYFDKNVIIEKLTMIGFTKDEIESTIKTLLDGNIIEKDCDYDSDGTNILISINPRGFILARHLLYKYSFFVSHYHTLSHKQNYFNHILSNLNVTDILDGEYALFNFEYLSNLAVDHLKSLLVIRNQCFKNGISDWFSFYCSHFCLIIKESKLEHNFQIPIILRTHINYFERSLEEPKFLDSKKRKKTATYIKAHNKLLNKYEVILSEMASTKNNDNHMLEQISKTIKTYRI